MNLYKCFNGWMGSGYTHVIVVADSESRAKELATLQFTKESKKSNYHESYKVVDSIDLLVEDLTNEWCSDVESGD